MCPMWLLVVAVVGVARGAASQCWEHPVCQEPKSESSVLECIHLCRSDLTVETPAFPGDAHLQPLSPSPSSLLPPADPHASSQDKRSYSMEHFRWGKPVGRKRRPIKVYTSNSVEEESAEVFPAEMRRDLGNELTEEAPEAHGEARRAQAGLYDLQEKEDGSYKINHFRWGKPRRTKRYGGFMKSWDEKNQKTLMTLFKAVFNKDRQQQGIGERERGGSMEEERE
ncbi:pro-opiomelanocortin-like [Lampris incognitus]|uniref:pro-opiomelanocortin-like n=1 Tax=Lampris incognitus TaxID=2546036 RepID=UPI0024B4AD41|nr:pro-opiomelanocortin-like [Lampris incognitus]